MKDIRKQLSRPLSKKMEQQSKLYVIQSNSIIKDISLATATYNPSTLFCASY